MSPIARNLDNREIKKDTLSILLNDLTKQSHQIEESLSKKVNQEIIRNFHNQHDKVIAVKTYVRKLTKSKHVL